MSAESAESAPQTVSSAIARGALPTLIFFACLVLAFVFEAVSFIAVFGGLAVYAVFTASTIAHARHPSAAVTAATLAGGLVTAGTVLGAWAVLPIYWCFLAAASGTHVALRLLERRSLSFQIPGAIAGFAGGMIVGIMTPLRHTTVVGVLCLAALAGLAAFRLVRGRPVQGA